MNPKLRPHHKKNLSHLYHKNTVEHPCGSWLQYDFPGTEAISQVIWSQITQGIVGRSQHLAPTLKRIVFSL